MHMTTNREIKQIEKHWRRSRRAIPIYAGMLVAAIGTLWLLSRFVAIPLWVIVIVLGVTAFTLIGDIINCFHCARKLRTLKREPKG